MPIDVRVCFLGDSFVAGVGDPEHRGWVGRLAVRSSLAGQPVLPYNLGVRRETTEDVLARWQAECTPRLPESVDGRVVVSFGVNDTTHEDGRPRVSPAASVGHLTTLLRGAGDAGWSVLVVGPPAVDDEEQNERIAGVDRAFRHACADAQVPYAGVLEHLRRSPVWMREVAADDGYHPGAAGYQELADLVWPHWTAWLAGVRPAVTGAARR